MGLLQKQYIQKSRIFLFPLVGIRNDRIYRPTNTYVRSSDLKNKDYPNGISITDETLITVYTKDYKLREEDNITRQKYSSIIGNWEKFETETLMSNRNFVGFFENKDEYIYTFDLSDWSIDWYNFVKGKYSQLSSEAKDSILKFRWTALEPTEQRKLYCYLYAFKDECVRSFAKELAVDPRDYQMQLDMLYEAGELCTKPDLSLETYKFDNEIKTKQEELINESQD